MPALLSLSLSFPSDVNECDTPTVGCMYRCENTDGAYRCSCDDGFQLAPDGSTCHGKSASVSTQFSDAHRSINHMGTLLFFILLLNHPMTSCTHFGERPSVDDIAEMKDGYVWVAESHCRHDMTILFPLLCGVTVR